MKSARKDQSQFAAPCQWQSARLLRVLRVAALLPLALITGGCFPEDEAPYFGRVVVPQRQELRWSDGGLPRVFDPALAPVPPDTDAVRAMFEGLTELDAETLRPLPAVASDWKSSAGGREWTFTLRRDARWSNGDPVTAHDFVRSWRRALNLGQKAAHAALMEKIAGARALRNAPEEARDSTVEVFGAEALDDHVLRVRLREPDPDFPVVVSHPVFRPVHRSADEQGTAAVVNGPFAFDRADGQEVQLVRRADYWDARAVALERVRFIAAEGEEALARYRAGELDAVANIALEPAAVKLLASYKDYRRATFGALTFYLFNVTHAPLDDRRVRESLVRAIDRERLVRDVLGGIGEPATKFLPFGPSPSADGRLSYDVARARALLAEAGFPSGHHFPRLKLLVNRNEQHRLVAEAVAAMWRNALGIETEVIVKSWEEYEAALRAGDYDVARRSAVVPSASARASIEHIFTLPSDAFFERDSRGQPAIAEIEADRWLIAPLTVETEDDALREWPAAPLYFASSISLVRPYVIGFDGGLFDAPTLKFVRLDLGWRPPQRKGATLGAESDLDHHPACCRGRFESEAGD